MSVCLCFVTIFVILIEIKALRRINDFGSFRSVISSDGRPILRGGLNDFMDSNPADRPVMRGGLDELLQSSNPASRPVLRGGLDELIESSNQASPVLRGGLDELVETSKPAERPALRGGLDELLEKVDVDINVRLQPKEKRKNDQDPHHLTIPLQDDENPPRNADLHLRKRPKSSSEDSDDDDGLPIMRTVMPDSSPEKKESQETIEALTYLQTGGNKDDSSGEQTISLVREGDDNSDDPANLRQHSVKPKKMPEWTKDLKKYIRILSSKYPKNGMLNHIKPVIKVLERTHKVRIKDIDVDKRGRVKVMVKKGSKGK